MMTRDHQDALTAALDEYLNKDVEKIWPAAQGAACLDAELNVLPLERIGAPPGASGAEVFVVYYSDTKTAGAKGIKPSLPLTVKIGVPKSIGREFSSVQAWRTMGDELARHFAIPVHQYVHGAEHAVLIAPFKSGRIERFVNPDRPGKYRLELNDLWKLLESMPRDEGSQEFEDISNVINIVLRRMNAIHTGELALPLRDKVTYCGALWKYLRGTHLCNDSQAPRAAIPRRLFGTAQRINVFGHEWTNPAQIVDKLIDTKRPFETSLGQIHGDLHPKNIVLDETNTPSVIDFGWARERAPIVIDYILLDINVRSMTLPSQVDEKSILGLSKFLDPNQDAASLPSSVRQHARIIKKIWCKLQKHKVVKNWEEEYLGPLFVIAYGLLVHLDNARNQAALIATVLAAGDYLGRWIETGEN